MEDELLENPDCPMCSGLGMFLGGFGRFHYFRCRDCGWEFHEDAPVRSQQEEEVAS